jgi:hypothetical protein
VPTGDEVEGTFALADAAPAEEEDTQAMNVHENGVQSRRRNEMLFEEVPDSLDDDG